MTDQKDLILEVLQHDGGWMTLKQIMDRTRIISTPYVALALENFVSYEVVEVDLDEQKGRRWKAIMERTR